MSVTSAGQIAGTADPPYFVLIEKALRDEGTSHHYLPPGDFSALHPGLLSLLEPVLTRTPVAVYRGATWTTDAPFRETASAVAHCRELGIMAVEMEAAALYAFARHEIHRRDVVYAPPAVDPLIDPASALVERRELMDAWSRQEEARS